ncbi:unnamed protein product [Blepharisma stoltei]|uniref:RDD domain-containing protein n=1 Tax=Blepharisma stoltei TaxID=1481888 RepID=A0AAU9IUZ4_9CILI|nr:unnamed protein product [Blepharisma stoltei]
MKEDKDTPLQPEENELYRVRTQENTEHINSEDLSPNAQRITSETDELNFQPISLDHPLDFKQKSESNAVYSSIIGYAKFTRWYSIIDCLICLIFLISEFYYLVLLIFVPIIGYLAGYHLNKLLLTGYIIYEVIISVIRVLIIPISNFLLFKVLTTMTVIFTFFIVLFLIRFYRHLGKINEEEKQEIHVLLHKRIKSHEIPKKEFN